MAPQREVRKFSIRAVLEYYGGQCPPPRGTWASMRCPFHADKTPSARVDDRSGKFHCFGCFERPEDAIGVIQVVESVDFGAAVRIAQDITGEGDGEVRVANSNFGALFA